MHDAEFQKLLNAAPPVTLYASKRKGILLVLGTALLIAGCIVIIHDSNQAKDNMVLIYNRNKVEDIIIGWAGLIFFGIGLLLGLGMLFLPKSMALMLDGQHFAVNVMWKERRYAWKDVSAFVAKTGVSSEAIKQIDLMRNVESVLDRAPPPIPFSGITPRARNIYFDDGSKDKKSAIRRTMVGYNCAIRGIYGLNPDRLAQLMNHWRERAINTKPNPVGDSKVTVSALPDNQAKTDSTPHRKAPEGW